MKEVIRTYGSPSLYLEGWYSHSELKSMMDAQEKAAIQLKKDMLNSLSTTGKPE